MFFDMFPTDYTGSWLGIMQLRELAKYVWKHRAGLDIILLVVLLLCVLVYASSCGNAVSATCITTDAISSMVALLITVNCTREQGKDTSMHLFTSVAWLTYGYIGADLLGWITLQAQASNFLQYTVDLLEILLGYAATMMFTRYVREFTGFHNKFMRILYYTLFILSGLFIVCLLATMPFGLPFKVVDRIYIRGPLYALFQAFPMFMLFIDMFAIMRSDKLNLQEKISLAVYCLAPLVAVPLQFLHYGVAATSVAMLVSMVIVYNNIFMQRNKTLVQQDNELTQNRVQMMVSQIQPHFLYNTLTSIANLCEKDPRTARQAIVDFSDYLRVNLDSLKCRQNVPFVKELEHCQTYLNFEKMRFEDDLNIIYDIQFTDFVIPILSVQPLLENAVKYGICGKAGGGTVRLSTYRADETVYVVIEDDGVGFDPTETPRDTSRQHIGLENVEYRIQQMCGGSVQVESSPGIGTKITISLPERKGGKL